MKYNIVFNLVLDKLLKVLYNDDSYKINYKY